MDFFNNARNSAFNELIKHEKVKVLDKSELKEKDYSEFVEVWEVISEIDEEDIRSIKLYIGFYNDFPLTLPKIYLSEEDFERYKWIPHLNYDRFICTFDPENVKLDTCNPYWVVYRCLCRAKKVVRDGIAKTNFSDFNEEFLNYWRIKYTSEDKVNDFGLVIIDGEVTDEFDLKVGWFSEELKNYNFIIHNDNSIYAEFEKYLKEIGIKIETCQAFYLGEVNINEPPFDIKNRDLIEIIRKSGNDKFKKFRRYVNASTRLSAVIFKKTINLEEYFLGWFFKSVKSKPKSIRPEKFTSFFAFSCLQKDDSLIRISPDIYNIKWFQKRTSGHLETVDKEFCFLIVGLGSIGSNLVYFLNSLGIPSLRLIDMDSLRLENISRHLLGFSYIKFKKVDAIKVYLKKQYPHQKISIKNSSIVKVIQEDLEFINSSDYIFITIGNDNVEEWLGSIISKNIIKKPVFFLWVEPYLAGGHCLYINQRDGIKYSDYFDQEGLFKFNIIDKEEYLKNDELLHLRVAGCNTTYTPYSYSNIVLFLSNVFPKIHSIILKGSEKNKCYSWIGDLSVLSRKSIKLSEIGLKNKIGDIFENSI